MNPRFTRRQFASTLAAAPLAAAPQPPNVVVILSDDHSAPYAGPYGYPVRTPRLDRFAAEGMRFDRAFTAAPQCVPSRAAIMTGRSPVAVRISRFTSPLPPDILTLPDLLRRNGYHTGICRRWFHLDGPGRTGPVTSAIFERHGLRTFHKRVDFLDNTNAREKTPDIVGSFLDQAPKGRPFFLWANFSDPHHVWDKDAIPDPYDPAKLPLPAHLPDLSGVREDLARYLGEVTRMDSEFGSILDVLERRGLADNTIVVFMGDNGMAFPHGKGSLYDPGLNVPLLVRWPGVVKGGTATRDLISGEDITPTLLEAAGVSPLREMSGRSFLKLLRGEAHEPRRQIFGARLPHGSATFTETTRADTFDLSRCVRTDRHKLIYNCTPRQEYWPVDSARDAGWQQILEAHRKKTLAPALDRAYFSNPRPVIELYDLEKDPSELNNIADRPENAELARELKIALQEKMILDYDFLPVPLAE